MMAGGSRATVAHRELLQVFSFWQGASERHRGCPGASVLALAKQPLVPS